MTSRTPRDTRLSIVPEQALATARRSVSVRRSRPAPRPPARLAPREQLARQARAALGEAVRLARWADARGRSPVLDPGPPAEALGLPAGQITVHWDRARLAGLVELHADAVRAGWRLRAWDRDDSAVLRGWVALFDAWSLACPAPASADPSLVGDVVVAAPQLLSVMHLSSGPVTEPALLELLTQRIAELHAERDRTGTPVPGTAPGEPAALLAWALDGLSAVGALTRCQDPGQPGQAQLTPLGDWAVWAKLEQICVAALSPAGNIEQCAEDMLRGCARLSPGPARDEYRAWLAARPTGPAVRELLAAARGEDALVRALAFEALRVVGAPAEPAVREAAADPALRPYALLWVAEHEGADPEDLAGGAPGVLSRDEAAWLWVDTAAAVADHGESQLLVDHLESAVRDSVPRLLEEVRATGHPRTVQVLVALAAAHPDPALARAVRRAAFQVHSGGA
ncbi:MULTISPECIES: hypothetical protein [unclassified Streptomyces]|uniref:hypothetical protein n=1 Tax=unclassified Streptomyces TaxID=2593676 RepID=UPI0022B65FCA|nr:MULTISPECIES: hypothetical protein [unclassified Streptomyces]MCZ7413573.1 hypothetical protein [Streptomyces sp. WMMC897]MCZ7430568.1 hypothetical protein [Streptomyces sp. WMMC1477]